MTKATATDVAVGFRDADGATPATLVNCLDFMNGLPFFRSYKSHSWESLGIVDGASILDVGCGVGFDVIGMARAYPGAAITGADKSESFLAIARARGADLPNARFVHGDAESLPFPEDVFDGARVDRSLQHIADPRRAIAEMIRVTRPGGRIVAVEPDWGTFTLFNGDRGVGARMASKWLESFAHPYIGREIGMILDECGATDIRCDARALAITDLKDADVVYDLPRLMTNCVASGALTQADARDWRARAEAASATGTFLACLTIIERSARAPA